MCMARGRRLCCVSQFDHIVEKQRLRLEAEEWAKQIKSVHVHQLKSCWYDDRPQDTDDGSVTDIQYNSVIVVRHKNGKVIHTFGKPKKGASLILSLIHI